MFCNHCGAKLAEGSRFCNGCGGKVGEEPTSVQTPGPTTRPQQAPSYVLVAVLVVAIAGVVFWLRSHDAARQAPPPPSPPAVASGTVPGDVSQDQVDADAVDSGEELTTEEEAAPEPEPEPAPAPVPADDPVAEATVVLENYLAADLGHDGNEMARYLGGQAAARFRPEVQGQEDVTVHSNKVSGHTVKDPNTIVFKVAVRWSMEDGGEAQTSSERYTVRRTTKGWRITSTPAYP